MSLTAFLRRVIQILDDAGVPYMVTGSLASAFYAVPRATQDLDIVVETEESGIRQVVQALLDAGYYVDRDAALEARRMHGQFNAIDPHSGWKVDLIVRRNRQYSSVEFERRIHATVMGVEVAMASLEDVLIAKLEWSMLGDSALQRRDVIQLLERTGDSGYGDGQHLTTATSNVARPPTSDSRESADPFQPANLPNPGPATHFVLPKPPYLPHQVFCPCW